MVDSGGETEQSFFTKVANQMKISVNKFTKLPLEVHDPRTAVLI